MFCWPFRLILLTAAVSMVRGYDKRIFDATTVPVLSVVTKAGENKTFGCPGVNEHSLVLALEWRFITNNQKLVEYMGDSTITVLENRHRISLLSDTFSLNFHPAVAEDSGDYACLVNSRPKPDAIVKLIVQDVPDPPGRPLIMGFTSRSVNLSWAPSQDTHHSPVTHYIIHTRVEEDSEWNVADGILTPDNSTVYQVTKLHPYTVYSFRVVAVNAMGASAPSKESYYMVTLREAPAGKPTITTAHNTSATALHISWRPPHPDTIHGEFLGYRITFRPRESKPEAVREIYIRDSTIESHTIQDLETYTQYLVSLQVFNPEGPGPSTTVLVMTDEGAPSKPLNLTVLEVTSNNIQLRWRDPEHPNGAIEGYRIYFINANFTDVQNHKLHNAASSSSSIYKYYNLTNLKPNSEYKIWVKAHTSKNEGDASDPVINRTDISGPSAPRIINATCASQDSLFLHWERPEFFYNSIDFYYVNYSNNTFSKQIPFAASKDYLDTSFSIENLTINTDYEVTVSAASYSRIYTGRVILGETSQTKKVFIESNCDKLKQNDRHPSNELSAGMIAGVACAAIAFLLAITAFVLWRKCFHAAYYYLDDPPCSVPTASLDWNATPEPGGDHKGAIPTHTFARHVAELHADGDIGFSKEYESIQAEASNDDYTSEHSQHPENRAKNRYLNIIAYDHSRVQLLAMPGQKKNIDYVNANYIDGFQRCRAYIGTQGPLPSTFDCFWRMIWEQRVNIIVMITNLVERGRRKCDMYWPIEKVETYGVIQVKLVKEDVTATYTVRTFLIRHLKIKKKKAAMAEKTVYQYHYTNWPDHGTPDHPLPVLHFVKKSAAANPVDAGPIVVHCSAGVGRTGTYIVIDAMLRQIRTLGQVNIYGFLRHIRTQRNFLVQTEEQYIFIHDAILEYIESGETNISREQIPKYVQMLQSETAADDKTEPWKGIDTQFKLVTKFQCKEFDLVSANKVINQPKNRNPNLVPVETSRVHLTPKPGEDGSDYINATWMQGFYSLREYIITQHPLKHTVKDFWQMIWDHNPQAIVMLSTIDNQEYDIFWPTEQETIDADSYKVKLVKEQTLSHYITRDFAMRSLQDDYEMHVPMIQCLNWPMNCSSLLEMFHLPTTVLDMQCGYQKPLVIIDRCGGTEAATFCCLSTLKKHLSYENYADVYMYAKLYHNKRPGIWTSVDDYLRLHLAVQALCSPPEDTPDLYAMANGAANGSVSNECIRVPPEGMEAVSPRLSVA